MGTAAFGGKIPRGESALGIILTRIIDLAALGLLDHYTLTAIGTRDAAVASVRHRRFTFGIVTAGKEISVRTLAEYHIASAIGAF